jgi:hypothetical protein
MRRSNPIEEALNFAQANTGFHEIVSATSRRDAWRSQCFVGTGRLPSSLKLSTRKYNAKQ